MAWPTTSCAVTPSPWATYSACSRRHLESLWGGPNPVSATLRERGYALYLEWWEKLNREHEAALWRIRHDVD